MNATVYDVNAGGQIAVVTTSIGVANSTNPNTPYLVSIPFSMSHTFSQSSSVKLSLRASGVGQLYLWYDSAADSSSLVLPASNVPTVTSIVLRNYALNQTTTFSLNWTAQQRIVLVLVHVDDPFGAYSVNNATVTIVDPSNSQVYSAFATPFTTPPESPEKLFGLNWVYSSTAQTGNYAIFSSAMDSAGNQASGSAGFTMQASTGVQPPPSGPTPQPWSLPTYIWGLLGAGIALAIGLLAFFLFFRNHAKCPKCGAKVSPGMTKCPKCGATLSIDTSKKPRTFGRKSNPSSP